MVGRDLGPILLKCLQRLSEHETKVTTSWEKLKRIEINLSYDTASRSDLMPCIKIDKPLVLFTGFVTLCNDVH